MKKLGILLLLILGSRIANAQADTLRPLGLARNLSDERLTMGGYGYTTIVTFDTVKCIMLCADTAAHDSGFLISRPNGQTEHMIDYRHDVWWEHGYMVRTDVWQVHVKYLDKQKKPYKGFIWMAYQIP